MVFSNSEVAADYLVRLELRMPGLPEWYHFFKLWEESGEVPKAYLQMMGMHRHGDDVDEDHLLEELADTVITCYAIALQRHRDLDAAIRSKHTVLMTMAMKDGGTDGTT